MMTTRMTRKMRDPLIRLLRSLRGRARSGAVGSGVPRTGDQTTGSRRDGTVETAVQLGRSPASIRDSGGHRRPPPLEPLDRLGADERDGDELDDEGRVVPWDGTFGLVVVELPAPVLVEGWVWVFPPDPVLLPDELPEPVDGATASGFEPEDRLGAEPVAPEPELGRVAPWPG